jgi:CrcB protein
MVPALIVFLGAGIGGACRHFMNQLSVRWFGFGFPWGTMIINVLGSLLMGLLAGFFAFKGGSGAGLMQHARLFLTTGVLGGFTTFSTFSLDAATLWERGDVTGSAFYVVASVGAGLVGLFAGLAFVRAVT